MLGVYTWVFRGVFKLRWPDDLNDSHLGYALHIYAGLAVFNFFADCVNRAPRLVIDQPHLVKKVIFPLEILPWVTALTGLIHLGIAWGLMVMASAFENGSVQLTVLLAPLVWLPLLPLCLGLGWLLAGIGTFFRDISQILALLLSLMMFLSPIFFPLSSLPQAVQVWAALNPLALPITFTRQVMLQGIAPNWLEWSAHLAVCCALAWVGAKVFSSIRRGFADVL
jgi:lipopolysaccharide transport system permease protein